MWAIGTGRTATPAQAQEVHAHIRKLVRSKMEDGPITDEYKADRNKVVDVLNTVLATELVCMLRYKNHYYMAKLRN